MESERSSFETRSNGRLSKAERLFLDAVYLGNEKCVKKCISNGIDPGIYGEDGHTALHIIAERGNLIIGEILLKNPNIDVNIRTKSGKTPLMMAVKAERRNFVQMLLRKSADPNLRNRKGQTALHLAVNLGLMGITFDLVTNGADVNVVDAFERTPVYQALIDNPHPTIARFLLNRGAQATSCPLLLECVLNCNSDKRMIVLRILVSYGVDLNCTHPISQRNCLHYVAITGYLPAARFLLEKGARLRQVDVSNRTPLQMAIEHEHRDVVKLFREGHMQKKVVFTEDENLADVSGLFSERGA